MASYLVGFVIMPGVIAQAYRGESWPVLNGIISGQSVHTAEFYLAKWRVVAVAATVSIVVFWLVAMLMTSRSFALRCVGMATPGTLGAIRFWTCAILLGSTLWDDLASVGRLPLAYHFDMGIMSLLHALPIGFDRFVTSESSLRLWQWATEILLFLGMIGWHTRLIIPVAAVFALVMNGILREISGYWHQNLVPIYILLALSFTPCADGWSIDRLRKIARGEPVADPDKETFLYGWARYACWVPFALTYASAGFSKLRATGLGWFDANSFRAHLYEQTLYPRWGNHSISLQMAPAPDWVFTALAASAVLGEALFITVLFSRTARKYFPAITAMMHVGIIFMQNIFFVDLICLLLIFYNLRPLRLRIAERLARRGSMALLFDGECRLCRRTVLVLGALDLFRRLAPQDFRTLDLDAFNRQNRVQIDRATLEHEIAVAYRGQVHLGFEAYRAMARALPALWPVLPFLFVPGLSALGRGVYAFIARRRFTLGPCDATCTRETVVSPVRPALSARPAQRFILVAALALAAVIAVQSYVWANRLEFYPFTAVQMFTDPPRTTVVYFKTFARLESGELEKFELERTLPVLSINSRYEQLFMLCFSPIGQYVDLCKETLGILGTAYNEKAREGQRITALEIERWKWDFRADPNDPNYGYLERRVAGDVPVAGARVSNTGGAPVADRRNP